MESISITGIGPSYEEAVGEAMATLISCSGNNKTRVFRKEIPNDAVDFIDWALDLAEAELVVTNANVVIHVSVECTFWLIGSEVGNE